MPNPGSCEQGEYVNGVANGNGVATELSGWVLMTEGDKQGVTTSWTGIDTSVPSEWKNPPSAEAYDLQIRGYGTAVNIYSGAHANVHIDNFRGESR